MRRNYLIFALVVFIIAAGQLYAVDARITELYQQVDSAFLKKDATELDGVLRDAHTTEGYDLVESYAMKKIRRLIVAGRYDEAQNAVLVVIDNNLENTEAVEMYSAIEDSIDREKVYEAEQERKRQEELARIEEEKQKQRKSVDKEYQAVKSTTGSSVYLNGRDEKYTPAYWSLRFALADLMFASVTGSTPFRTFRYGLSADYTWEYTFPTMVFGFDADVEGLFLTLYNDDKTILGSAKIVPKIYFPKFSKILSFRAGAAAIVNLTSNTDTLLHATMFTPVAGIGFDHAKLGTFTLSGNYDYYFGHFAVAGMKSAMGGGINIYMPMAEMENMEMGFTVGLKDDLFILQNGIENRCAVMLALGVKNVTN